MTITAVSVLWSVIVRLWLYILSNAILSVGMLLILIHLVMVLFDKLKNLLK